MRPFFSDLPRGADEIDLLNDAGEEGWQLVGVTANNIAYLEPRAQRVGAAGAWWRTIALSMLNSLAAGCGAFMLGVVARWLWW